MQTGVGRLGEWFAFQRLGVRPDAICLAKGLGAGLPIGALIADEVGDGFQRGDHASTFGGSPPIAAAALAVLDAIEQEGLVENARTIGAHLAERASADRRRRRGARARAAARGRARRGTVGDVAAALRERGVLVNAITPTRAAPGARRSVSLAARPTRSAMRSPTCSAAARRIQRLHDYATVMYSHA